MKTIKEAKPKKNKLVVDLTNIDSENEAKFAFVLAKVNQQKVITPAELETVIEYTLDEIDNLIDQITEDLKNRVKITIVHEEKKKKNIFVRFWRWLTGKKD